MKLWHGGLVDGFLKWPIRRPAATLIAAAVIVTLAVFSIMRLEPASSLQSMMDAHDPSAAALGRILSDFDSVDKLLLVASHRGEPDRDVLAGFAERLFQAVGADPELAAMVSEIRYSRGGSPDDRAFFEEQVVPSGLYYLSDEQFSKFLDRLSQQSIEQQVRRNEQLIAAPGPAADALSRVLQNDPLRLREFLVAAFAERLGATSALQDELLLSRDGRSLLLIIAARRPASDLDFTKSFLGRLQAAAESANQDQLLLEYTGSYAIAAASERAIRGDMIRSVIVAVLLMQVMFLVMHRRPLAFGLVFLPTAVAIVVAFGLHAAFQTQLTPATAVVGAVIAGLGIDYSIHLMAHYAQARHFGDAPADAALSSARELLLPTVAAAGTTFIGVLAIGQSPVQALRDFSTVALLGLVGAMVAAFTILPAVLVFADRLFPAATRTSSRFEARFSMLGFTSLIDRRSGLVLALALAAWIAVAAFVSMHEEVIPVEHDLTVMHPRPNPALDMQERIGRDFDMASNTLLVHMEAESAEELVSKAHQVDRALQSAETRSTHVRGVAGLSTVLPDPHLVEARRALIAQINVEQVLSDFRSAIDRSIFDRHAFPEFELFLRRFLTGGSPPDLKALRRYEHLSGMMLPRGDIEAGSESYQAISVIQLAQPLAERGMRDRVITSIRAAIGPVPNVTLTGLSVISHDVERSIASDLAKLSLVAAGAVVIFLAIFVRNLLHLMLALTPTAVGLTAVLAGFHAFGDGLNMMNLVGIPLLMGIGDNFGIFVVDALRRHRRQKLSASEFASHLAASARAITLTSITAILGFGALMFTSTPAIQSLGRLTALGVAASLAGTFFIVMPITFLLAHRRRQGSHP